MNTLMFISTQSSWNFVARCFFYCSKYFQGLRFRKKLVMGQKPKKKLKNSIKPVKKSCTIKRTQDHKLSANVFVNLFIKNKKVLNFHLILIHQATNRWSSFLHMVSVWASVRPSQKQTRATKLMSRSGKQNACYKTMWK